MFSKWILILSFITFIMTKTCRTKDDTTKIAITTTPPTMNVNQLNSYYSWMKTLKILRNDFKDCLHRNNAPTQFSQTTWGFCLKVTTLKIFDDIMSSNLIALMDGVKLVKISTSNHFNVSSLPQKSDHEELNATKFPLIKMLNINNKNSSSYYTKIRHNYSSDKRNISLGTWFKHVSDKILQTFSTHVIQINLVELQSSSDETEDAKKSHARHRRHRNNMMMAMVFGVTAMGAVIVPLGFQLLSMMSGKALLLAKMALLLASINGVKRIANSGVHYGLYQAADPGYYDRSEKFQQYFPTKKNSIYR